MEEKTKADWKRINKSDGNLLTKTTEKEQA